MNDNIFFGVMISLFCLSVSVPLVLVGHRLRIWSLPGFELAFGAIVIMASSLWLSLVGMGMLDLQFKLHITSGILIFFALGFSCLFFTPPLVIFMIGFWRGVWRRLSQGSIFYYSLIFCVVLGVFSASATIERFNRQTPASSTEASPVPAK